jgi:predicted  nucleic acid-binding Zn-ribbon protein
MTSGEIARLDRRIDGVDETVRALSDSILDIREVQDRHTAMLDTLDGRVGRLETAMLQISAQLTEVLRRLPEPS